MRIEHLIIASITVILTSLSFRTRNVLNNISKTIIEDKKEQNSYEVVMQPKWLLHSVWVLTLVWIYLTYLIFQVASWWTPLYILGFYFSVLIVSKLLPFPSIKACVDLFYSTVNKRLSNEAKYNLIEIGYLKIAKAALDKIRNPDSSTDTEPHAKSKKRSVLDNPIQRRVFEKMGTIYKVTDPDTDDNKNESK